MSRASPERTLFYQLAVSAPILAVASIVAGEPPHVTFDATAASGLLFQSVVVAFASYLAWFWLLTRYQSNEAGVNFLATVIKKHPGELMLRSYHAATARRKSGRPSVSG